MFRTWYLIKYLLFLVSWNFVFSQEPSPAAAPRPAPAPAAAGVARNAVVEEVEVVLPLASERIDDVEVLEELMGRQLSVTGRFTLYDFSKRYHCLSSVTEWFYDGHRRVINDFQVPSMFTTSACHFQGTRTHSTSQHASTPPSSTPRIGPSRSLTQTTGIH